MNERKYGVILGYVFTFLRNGSSFILTPFMLSVWSQQIFGVYQLSMTVAGYFMLLDMGLHNAIVKFMSEFRFRNEKDKENLFCGFLIYFYGLLSLLIAVIGLTLINYFPNIFANSLTENEIDLAVKLFIIMLLNTTLNLFFNTFIGIANAYEKFKLIRYREITKILLRFILILYLLKLNYTPFAIIITDTILNLTYNLSITYIVFFDIKIRPKIKGLTLGFIKKIFNYTFFLFINVLAFQLFWMIGNLVLGITTSSSVVAVYSIGMLVNSYFQSFSAVIQGVLMPGVSKMVEMKSTNDALLNESVKIGRITLIMLLLPTFGFIFLGKKFIILWAGDNYVTSYYITMIIIIPQIFSFIQSVPANVMLIKEKHKLRALILVCISFINIGLTIILVKKYGVIGAAISTSISFIFGYLLFSNIYYHFAIDINMVKMHINIFRNLITPIFLITAVCYFISLMPSVSWTILIIQSLLIIVVYITLLWSLGLNSEEKRMLKSIRI